MLYSNILYPPQASTRDIKLLYTYLGVLRKKPPEFKTLKIAFGLCFFYLCVSSRLVLTTRFAVKFIQKSLTYKALPSL